MLVFDAGVISEGFNHLAILETILSSTDGWIDKRDRRDFYTGRIAALIPELATLGLKVSHSKAEQIHILLTTTETFSHAAAAAVFKQYCATLRENIQVEL